MSTSSLGLLFALIGVLHIVGVLGLGGWLLAAARGRYRNQGLIGIGVLVLAALMSMLLPRLLVPAIGMAGSAVSSLLVALVDLVGLGIIVAALVSASRAGEQTAAPWQVPGQQQSQQMPPQHQYGPDQQYRPGQQDRPGQYPPDQRPNPPQQW